LVLKGQTATSLHGMVVDPNNAGIAGATVSLVPGGRDSAGKNRDPNGGSAGNAPLQTTTDANGNYVFEHLLPGLYIGKASKDAYWPTIEPVPVLPHHDNEHSFVLHPQGPPPPNGFGHIFGHVFAAGSDPATNQPGPPIPGATVDLYDTPLPPPNSMVPPPVPIRTTTTDDTGFYVFKEVPAYGQEHPYFLIARKDGYLPSDPKPAYVFPQQGTEVNFVLFPFGPPPPQGFGHIFGHVFAGAPGAPNPGTPLPGAIVDLYNVPLPPPGSMAPMPMPYRSTQTDTTGLYKFMEVPAYGQEHPYFLIAHKDGYLPSDPKPAYVFPQQGTEVNFWLAPGPPPPQIVPIHGTVWGPAPNHPDQTIGIPGVNVYAAPLMIDSAGVSHGIDPGRMFQTVTGPDGGYQLFVPPGPYTLWTHKEGWTADIHDVPVGPDGASQDFFIHPFGPDVQTAVFTGTVKCPGGSPIPGAHVILAMVPPPGWMGPGWFIPVKDTFTGPEGGFAMDGIIPDGYMVIVQKDGFQQYVEARVFQPGDNQTADYVLYPVQPPPPPNP
jgi:hypothetical protein